MLIQCLAILMAEDVKIDCKKKSICR